MLARPGDERYSWMTTILRGMSEGSDPGATMKPHKHRPETEAVRGGTDLRKKNGPLSTPIYQTSTFEVTDNEQQVRAISTDQFYTRYGNPTHTAAEAAIAELEGADGALLFASGMAAITTSIFALLKSGDHIVAQRDVYGGASKFLGAWLQHQADLSRVAHQPNAANCRSEENGGAGQGT